MDKVRFMRWLLGLLILFLAENSLAKVKTPDGQAQGKQQVASKIGLDPLNNDVYEVGFGDGVAPLRGTGSHPLYSLDRDDWVQVRDLQVGERLQTAEGAVSVEALEKVRGLHRVYNLEVEGDHEYLVGDAQVRAHNTCPGRKGAFREAKRDLGIPRAQQPDAVNRIPVTNRNGKVILGADGKPMITREYTFTRPDGSKVVIQDHSAGHRFGAPGGAGDQGPHFNVRPPENTRTGKVPGTKEHYSF